MAEDREFRDFLTEQLGPLGPIGIRNMFGGAGIYCRGVMFGLLADEVLYFKVDDRNREDYQRAGAEPFTYEAKGGRKVVMSYCQVPDALLDDPEELLVWARKTLDAALRARQPNTGRRRDQPRRRRRA